jgi:hypothetical protein
MRKIIAALALVSIAPRFGVTPPRRLIPKRQSSSCCPLASP